MFSLTTSGDWRKTETWLASIKKLKVQSILNKYGQIGVGALASATPSDSGKTAASWGYEISMSGNSATITWNNSNQNAGVNIAVILQYGHGTGTGGYVAGRDYINPAMRPVFDKITEDVWREIQNL